MKNQKFKPFFDKFFWTIAIVTAVILVAANTLCIYAPIILLFLIPLDLFILYFFVSPFFGYVELRKESLFIKFGFILKKEIPYKKIRGIVKERKLYSESMLSLKNAIEHVNIKYNSFDVITVSVINNDAFIEALEVRKKSFA